MTETEKTLCHLVPDREELLLKIEQANLWTMPIVGLQAAVIAGVAIAIDWTKLGQSPFTCAAAIATAVGPFVLQILQVLAQNKKEISKLRKTTWFGDFDKELLRELFDDALEKLGLPKDGLPVYVTADRSMNAFAAHAGLGVFSLRFNGIYLNRQLLHRFTAAEVQDTMGHELGHYYAHFLTRTRYQILSCILAALLAIMVVQWLGVDSILGYLALISCSGAAFFFTGRIRSDQMQAIEFLCDDFGAHLNGAAVGINALMKLGASAEAETTVFYETILANQFSDLGPTEILKTLKQTIPYGHISEEELSRNVADQLRKKKAQSSVSLIGFLKYAWQTGDEEDVEDLLLQQAKAWRRVQTTPRLPWESLLEDPTNINFHGESLRKLIDMMEANPAVPLFHEIAAEDTSRTHPPTKMRILYLWYNREKIANSPANPIR